jgi:hypothetical protein
MPPDGALQQRDVTGLLRLKAARAGIDLELWVRELS